MMIESALIAQVRKGQQEDSQIKLLSEVLKAGSYDDYLMRDNALYRFDNGENLLVSPKAMQNQIIRNVHERGHIHARKVEAVLYVKTTIYQSWQRKSIK